MNDHRLRVLYVERAQEVGGSVISLYELVSGLDRTRYEPVVLFHHPNKFRAHFEAINVPTLVLNRPSRQPSQRDRLSKYRENKVFANLYHSQTWLKSGFRSTRQAYQLLRRDLPLARSFTRLIKDEEIDIVHNNNTPLGNRASVIGAWMARVPRICHVRMLHEFTRTEQLMTQVADYFVFISRSVAQNYRQFGIGEDRSQIIYNPFEIEISHSDERAAEVRAELKLGQEDFVISNVGRLDWWKGHDYFLQSLAPIVRENPKVKALIVGASDDKDINKDYVQGLYKLVDNLNLRGNIRFTGHRNDIPQIMDLSDLVVHSASQAEPFGRVIVEAMMVGCPIIATAAGGPLEIIEDGVTGFLVPPRDIGAMSEAILRVMQHPDQVSAMVKLGRKVARERYSSAEHVADIQKIYDRLLKA